MGKILKFLSQKNYLYLYLILAVVAVIIFTYGAYTNVYLPYDDIYSIALIQHSYGDILHITAHDVHPPLYYWALKAFSSLFGTSLFALRMFSVLGVFAILALGCFPIRKLWGIPVSLFFVGLFILFPATQHMAVNIRMYSWTAFFVLFATLFAYRAYVGNNWKYWLACTLTAICATYLHNYGLLAVAGIYLVLLATTLYTRQHVTRLLIAASLVALAYLPWLLTLLGQMSNIVGDYWIKELTWGDFMLHTYYLYSPKLIEFPFVYFSKTEMVVALVIVMLSQLLIGIIACSNCFRVNRSRLWAIAGALFIFSFPILFGILFSFAIFPILAPRYMLCAFPLLVLALAWCMAQVATMRKLRCLVVVSCILLTTLGAVRYRVSEATYQNEGRSYARAQEFAQEDDMNTIFVANAPLHFALARVSYIVPTSNCFVLDDGSKPIGFDPFNFPILDLSVTQPDQLILVSHSDTRYENNFADFEAAWGHVYEKKDFRVVGAILLLKMRKKKPTTNTNIVPIMIHIERIGDEYVSR